MSCSYSPSCIFLGVKYSFCTVTIAHKYVITCPFTILFLHGFQYVPINPAHKQTLFFLLLCALNRRDDSIPTYPGLVAANLNK